MIINNYLSMGFTCSGSEEEQKPQCMICFEVLSNEALKPSKLKSHLETKHKEHVTKTIDFFKNKEYELRKNMKCIKKSLTSYSSENAVKASFAVSLLIGKSGKPHTIAEDLILPAANSHQFDFFFEMMHLRLLSRNIARLLDVLVYRTTRLSIFYCIVLFCISLL